MEDSARAAPEVLLSDTSYVGRARAGIRYPERVSHWPRATVQRIASAVLAISVVTVAEERSGQISAGWGPKSVTDALNRLRAFTWIPIDMQIVERWALLDAQCRRAGGPHIDDNDKWIAATAIEHDLVLVTCDEDQSKIPGLRSPVYLPPTAT